MTQQGYDYADIDVYAAVGQSGVIFRTLAALLSEHLFGTTLTQFIEQVNQGEQVAHSKAGPAAGYDHVWINHCYVGPRRGHEFQLATLVEVIDAILTPSLPTVD